MPYTSANEVKSYLGISGNSDDVLLATLAVAAQASIDVFTRRTFEADTDATRHFDAIGTHIGGGVLYIDEDLCEITTVTNGDGTVVTSSQYTTLPRNRTPYYGIRLLSNSGVNWTFTDEWMDAIEVTGKWGYSTDVPSDVRQACTRLAAWAYRQKDQPSFDTTIIEAGVVAKPFAIPPDVAKLIRHYIRL